MNVELMLLTVLQGLRTQILDAGMLFSPIWETPASSGPH